MLGTSPDAFGGIASVIGVYYDSGIISECNIVYIATHCTGTVQKKMATLCKAWRTFTSLAFAGKIAIVHIHLACGISFWRKSLFAAYTILLQIPFIIHLHSGNFPKYYCDSSSLTKFIIRCVLGKASATITVSRDLKLWLEQILKNHDVIVMHNPIYFSSIQYKNERDESKIVFLGRIEAAKGITDLILAVQHISLRHPNIRLVIAGSGDIATAKKMAADLGMDSKIEFPGWVAGEVKRVLLSSATLFVLPSYAEGMPMAVLEAMSHGTAVIATEVGGIPEVVHDRIEGLLVPPGDVAKLAEAIALLLSNNDMRERLGKAGQDAVRQHFSPKSTSAALLDLYAKLQP